jgi:hypothetical protein
MGHTPGPWVVREPDAEERLADIAEGRSPGDMELTEVYGDRNEQVCFVMNTTPNEAANARLIAAAPELLIAARCALADLEGVVPEFEPSGDRKHPAWTTIHELKQAIAKAEGKSLERRAAKCSRNTRAR